MGSHPFDTPFHGTLYETSNNNLFMFVINPDPYSTPCYRIGPFRTDDMALNRSLPESNLIDEYLHDRFSNRNYIYTENGRKGINIALSHYHLKKEDTVTILTTSGNYYISGCVTHEIEKFCQWSRKIEPSTKVLFVNHEFGFPYENLRDLKKHNLPVIEDCANTFYTVDKEQSIGTVGDFVIYSFPKIFPIQIGGLLVTNLNQQLPETGNLNTQELRYIRNVLSRYIVCREAVIQKRIRNYYLLSDYFETMGFSRRFDISDGTVPGVFMFRKGDQPIDLPGLKIHFYKHGIQCSVFYGEDSFFIPVHQALNDSDLLYFTEVMKSFMKESRP
jgi:hypothetical protein